MATQYNNQAKSQVTIDGQTVNFSSNTITASLLDINSITLVKSQDKALVVSGGTINYTIVITNLNLTPISNFTFADAIPAGMTYATGTFKVNTAVQTPTIAGQNLSYVISSLALGVTTITFTCNVA